MAATSARLVEHTCSPLAWRGRQIGLRFWENCRHETTRSGINGRGVSAVGGRGQLSATMR
eukprot:1175362-Prorocentrum_minimum.AAC.2